MTLARLVQVAVMSANEADFQSFLNNTSPVEIIGERQ